tara:strand:+ start:30141 stop:30671 length:531 start_codon:yes stop_codon:yes gene_type:complete
MRFLGIILILLLLSGCYKIENKESNTELKQLYNSLIDELNKGDYKLVKYFSREGIVDTMYFDSVNWPQELKLFSELNISKSRLSDYHILTSQNGCEKQFYSKSDKNTIKRYEYLDCNNKLSVAVNLSKSSQLYAFSYYLELNNKGYLIEITSDVKMAYESDYRVEGKFITSEDKIN